ncbi:hypothetical protein SDRG_03196 [Saprolegnia diclina VS20]|uniref:Sulfhydryl oxidase n=1 Tax=Saprolegnia diclina (strain VS20) TaxID=1156394 RepID=T0R0B7_SAPDV|nr:hypothetical protein SDRG_03196 [Saprolegnia diclina VS20]EQC39770.1 hypothetical protein SDRG_03196 [Saprolegnia diclina VS20]|eukprot:XP_008607042.1 hypothetical protein SDRG_03196 [Saprolegnia diclina VS20]
MSVLQLLVQWAASTDDALFHSDGTTYLACTSYNCGLWMLLHRMSLSPVAARLAPALQLFMQHFGHCPPCRAFLERYHSIETLEILQHAPQAAITLRLHNAINSVARSAWPSQDECPQCVQS